MDRRQVVELFDTDLNQEPSKTQASPRHSEGSFQYDTKEEAEGQSRC